MLWEFLTGEVRYVMKDSDVSLFLLERRLFSGKKIHETLKYSTWIPSRLNWTSEKKKKCKKFFECLINIIAGSIQWAAFLGVPCRLLRSPGIVGWTTPRLSSSPPSHRHHDHHHHHHNNHWNYKIKSHFAVWVHSDGERQRGREVEEQGQEIKDGGRWGRLDDGEHQDGGRWMKPWWWR